MREVILENKLGLPSYQNFQQVLGTEYATLADKMFQAMWYQYLRNKSSVSTTYWSDRFNNPIMFNKVLIALSDSGWITTHAIPERNWGEAHINESKLLEYVTLDELEHVRASNKFSQYILNKEPAKEAKITRINGKREFTGLTRAGFMKAGNTVFTYDQHYMSEYKHIIQQNLTKSMDKIAEQCPNLRHDRASYDTISIEILDYHLTTDDEFTRGENHSDTRGRAISSALGKVANPISCKDFRGLLVIE